MQRCSLQANKKSRRVRDADFYYFETTTKIVNLYLINKWSAPNEPGRKDTCRFNNGRSPAEF